MMNYLIHNAVRARHNRTSRAQAATHRGMKQFMFQGQLRLIRGRPLPMTEEVLLANLEEIKAKVQAGLVYVTLGDMTPFDVMTLSARVAPKPAKPDFPQDSINRDAPAGLELSKFGDKPPPEHFDMPVAPPDAALENPVVAVAPEPEEEEGEDVEEDSEPGQAPQLDKPAKSGDARSKRRRR